MHQRIVSENLVSRAAALQSSYSRWSALSDLLAAITGKDHGQFSVHTGRDENPWWMADFGKLYLIRRIVVYNRRGASQRARNLRILLSTGPGEAWKEIYKFQDGAVDDKPVTLDFGENPFAARFIKVQLLDVGRLRLDRIEVFGFDLFHAYYKYVLDRKRRVDNFGDAAAARAAGAIVVLTRGYTDVTKYRALIERNRAIFEHVNQYREIHYPLIIFHEGNITIEHQKYILNEERNRDVRFIDVSEDFTLPDGINTSLFREHWRLGYRLMCRFNCLQLWKYVTEFEYILRVDEDCILSSIIRDPFDWARSNDLDFGYSIMFHESHSLTNNTLPIFVDAYSKACGIDSNITTIYNQVFPYTNVFLARVAFFTQSSVTDLLGCVSNNDDFLLLRWGDLPIFGVVLNLYSTKEKSKPIPTLSYRHDSHGGVVVTANDSLVTENASKLENFQRDEAAALDRAKNLVAIGRLREAEKALLVAYSTLGGTQPMARLLCQIMKSLGRRKAAERLARVTGRP